MILVKGKGKCTVLKEINWTFFDSTAIKLYTSLYNLRLWKIISRAESKKNVKMKKVSESPLGHSNKSCIKYKLKYRSTG